MSVFHAYADNVYLCLDLNRQRSQLAQYLTPISQSGQAVSGGLKVNDDSLPSVWLGGFANPRSLLVAILSGKGYSLEFLDEVGIFHFNCVLMFSKFQNLFKVCATGCFVHVYMAASHVYMAASFTYTWLLVTYTWLLHSRIHGC